MLVIAHRGASRECPENTLAAFSRAVEIGAPMIELDLRLSRDGVVFAAHDALIDPRTGAAPRFSELVELRGAEGRYPSLGEVLSTVAGRVRLNLELKERRAVPAVVREIQSRGVGPQVLLSSFDLGAARWIRALAPDLAIGYLCRRAPLRLGAALESLGATSLHVPLSAATPRLLRRAGQAGAPVYVWTVDDAHTILRLRALGVAGVFTNDPRGALGCLAWAPQLPERR